MEYEARRVVPWARVALAPRWRVQGVCVGGTAAPRHRPPLLVVSLSEVEAASILFHEIWHLHESWLSPEVLASIDDDGFGNLGVMSGCSYWDSGPERRARAFSRFAVARYEGWWTRPAPTETVFDVVLRGDLAARISDALYPAPRVTPGRAWRRFLPWVRS